MYIKGGCYTIIIVSVVPCHLDLEPALLQPPGLTDPYAMEAVPSFLACRLPRHRTEIWLPGAVSKVSQVSLSCPHPSVCLRLSWPSSSPSQHPPPPHTKCLQTLKQIQKFLRKNLLLLILKHVTDLPLELNHGYSGCPHSVFINVWVKTDAGLLSPGYTLDCMVGGF